MCTSLIKKILIDVIHAYKVNIAHQTPNTFLIKMYYCFYVFKKYGKRFLYYLTIKIFKIGVSDANVKRKY